MKIIFAALLTGVLLTGSAVNAQSAVHKSPELAFTIPGEGARLLSQYRGKVVALEFV